MRDHDEEQQRGFVAGLITAMADGGVSIPYVFLKHYHKLNLSDADAMLIIQLIAFQEKEEKAFPTIEEIQSRVSSDGDNVIRMLQRLVTEKIIDIVEVMDPISGMQVERYTLTPLWMRLASIINQEEMKSRLDPGFASTGPAFGSTSSEGSIHRSPSFDHSSSDAGTETALRQQPSEDNLFYIFEQEFGRPLTPMEVDMINGWLDQDQYPKPLILTALKEAVFAGKINFRYIDRILLDWNRNNIHTVEQAKEYTQKFRGMR